MDYVIFESGGKQYKASKGATVLIDKLSVSKDNEVIFDKIVLSVSGDQIQVGMPYVKNAQIKAKVLGDVLGDKLNILQYKAKSNYRRRVGFRKTMSKVEVSDIFLEGGPSKKEKSSAAKKEVKEKA